MTRSPTLEAWARVAVLPEVRYHVEIVRKVTGTRRELWIAREVSCNSSETVSALLRLSNEKGEDTEFLIELASGSNGGRSPTHGRTQMKKLWKIFVRNLLINYCMKSMFFLCQAKNTISSDTSF